MQRMQILHGLSKEEYINIFEPKICDQIVDESLISLFFEKERIMKIFHAMAKIPCGR